MTMKSFLIFALLLSAFSFELSASLFPAWAETKAPELTYKIQKVVYEAQQAMEKEEYLKAEQCLWKYFKKHPQKPHYLVQFTMGNVLTLMGKEKKALSYYETAADLYPEYAPTWQNMGKIYFDMKQYEKGGDCLLKTYELVEKKEPSLLYNVAVCYLIAGKAKKALPHLERLISGEKGPPKTEWLEALLKVYMDLKLKEKAFAVVRRLIDENRDNPRWWKILAQLHLQQNDYKKALAALTIHSYLTPLNREAIILLGDLSNAVGVPVKAAGYYEKALGLQADPSDYEKLASAYITAHRQTRALEVLDKALKIKPCSKLWFMMGHTLYQEEKFNKAYKAFDQSARLNPGIGRAYLMMGYCALHMNKKGKARMAFQKATRFSKQRKTAKKLLKHVSSLKER